MTMTAVSLVPDESALAAGSHRRSAGRSPTEILAAARKACSRVAPLWGLDSFVAVNPFWGFRQDHIATAAARVRSYTNAEILGERAFFCDLYRRGKLSNKEISAALKSGTVSGPGATLPTLERVVVWLTSPQGFSGDEQKPATLLNVAEALDTVNGSRWNDLFVEEISKFCGLYFDRGQAAWRAPFKEGGLFEEWRSFASIDRSLDLRALSGARSFFAALPHSYPEVISRYAEALALDSDECEELFARELFSVKGWAAFAQHKVFEGAKSGVVSDLVVELLAIRLAYALLLLSRPGERSALDLIKQRLAAVLPHSGDTDEDLLMKQICLEALEARFSRGLFSQTLDREFLPSQAAARSKLQAVFCIDVRSEGFRYALEAQSSEIETYGFAGFFGLFLRYRATHAQREVSQYPVLLGPKFSVNESAATPPSLLSRIRRHAGAFVPMVRQSISSGFSYVESCGVTYLGKMVKDALGLGGGSSAATPSCCTALEIEMSLEERVTTAKAMLRNMALRRPYAPIVLLCGHRAVTTNNPFAAGLDCGACGGHSGESNARVAAAILNDPSVRAELSGSDYAIPEDTRFVAAVHITTNDTVELLSSDELRNGTNDSTVIGPLSEIRRWLDLAGDGARRSRLLSLGIMPPREGTITEQDVFAAVNGRTLDWSEVRPEWGLAQNAAFIAARREVTRGVRLNNRSFLHEYDFTRDGDSSTLELILTAPVVVASWINLQYYGSSVSPEIFGSGNKVIHNVVGQLGVVLGNGGDLQVGLPFQSVHTGTELFHEPLRLHVVVEAPPEKIAPIIERHELLQQLIFNRWIKLFALDSSARTVRQLVSPGCWQELSQ